MEVCVDSVQSAINAEKGGAIRVELCGNLMEGGTTPTVGMLKTVKRNIKIPVYVMVRPRGGDFLYSPEEVEVMIVDVEMLKAAGADGFVLGFLTQNGEVERDLCRKFIDLVNPSPVTFHRAIDMSRDILQSLDAIMELGFKRVLTSGGCSSALEGLPVIEQMVRRSEGKLIVMPGGGVTENNLERILRGCGTSEFHCSARSSITSAMQYRKDGISMGASLCPPEYSVKVTEINKVSRLVKLKNVCL